MIKRMMLMDSHAQARAVETVIKDRILQLNEKDGVRTLSGSEKRERALLNEVYERISSHGTTIPATVTPSTWDHWIESHHHPASPPVIQ